MQYLIFLFNHIYEIKLCVDTLNDKENNFKKICLFVEIQQIII